MKRDGMRVNISDGQRSRENVCREMKPYRSRLSESFYNANHLIYGSDSSVVPPHSGASTVENRTLSPDIKNDVSDHIISDCYKPPAH